MNSVKTYRTISKEDNLLNFGVSKMEDIYQKRNGQVDDPHRHDFYTVLIVENAKGQHKIDFNSYDLGANQIFFVSPGQVHQVIEEASSVGYVMTFSVDFLIYNSIPLNFISDLNLFNSYDQSPPLNPKESIFHKIIDYCNEIYTLFVSDQKNKLLSIGALLKLILIQCSNSCTLHLEENEEDSKSSIIRDFKLAVDQNYKIQHSTSFYAELLNVSPDHLNRTVKKKIGKTAKEYIQTRIITEAKRLLYFTSLTNKEVGYELGFSEPANFSAFFKNCTNSSPSNFKKEVLKSK